MTYVSFGKALLARVAFAIIGIVCIWRVTDVYTDPIYYLLILPICFLPLEMILTLKFTDTGEWKWFCPSVFLFIASTVPSIWFLQMDLYEKRVSFAKGAGNCSGITYNTSSLNAGLLAEFEFGIPVYLADDSWALALEQFLLALLIVGRWLLPKGSLSRDQLSQLLLVYIGMAADILEFSLESLSEQHVMCNLVLIIIILAIWTWSLLQFSLVLTSVSAPRNRAVKITRGVRSCPGYFRCCENEIWALCITIIMQDGPFLAMRLYLLIGYGVINQMMLFFTIKNVLVILLQVYRMIIVCCDDGEEPCMDNDVECVQVVEEAREKPAKLDEISAGY